MVVEILLLVVLGLVGYIGSDAVAVGRSNSEKLVAVTTQLETVIKNQDKFSGALAQQALTMTAHVGIVGHPVMIERVKHVEGELDAKVDK